MQLGYSFSFLLTALLFALVQVEAVPVKRSRTITLPLKRLPQSTDLPPSVLLQQHINRGHRRHARMSGLAGPSNDELLKRLEKRLNQAKLPSYGKRFNHPNMKTPSNNEDIRIVGTNILTSGHHGNGNRNSTSNGTPAPSNSNSTSGEGFPQAGLDALLAGGLTKANPPTAPNSLGLDVEGNDVGYVATVQIGTPPRPFALLMDSGSADLWVGSENCTSEAGGGCGPHTFLGPQSSSSFVDSGSPFNITYGSGNVAGTIVTDNVDIAGLKLTTHTFGVALLESDDFSNDTTKFDGLMGLAQSPLSSQGVLTPVEALAKQGSITEAITSYKLSRVSDGKNDGEITFGGLDQTKFDASTLVTFDNVSPLGFWEGDLSVAVGGQDLGLTGRTGILDTGTTLMIIPDQDAQAIHAQIPGSKSDGQGGFIIPCTTTTVVSLKFGGQSFDINPVDMLFAPVDVNDLQGECISGIASGQIGAATQWLVGDVFLKNVYYSTNVNQNQISLAKLV